MGIDIFWLIFVVQVICTGVESGRRDLSDTTYEPVDLFGCFTVVGRIEQPCSVLHLVDGVEHSLDPQQGVCVVI